MRTLLLLALCGISLSAQTLTFSIHDNTGATPDAPLSSAYQFPTTPQGSSSSILVRVTNNANSPTEVVLVYVGDIANSPQATPDYTITGLFQNKILAPNASEYFMLNFTPWATGQRLGYLQVASIVQQSGCQLNAIPQCASKIEAVSTLEGTATAPQILLTYNNGQGSPQLQPDATARLDFGSVSTSSTSSLTFTLANQTSSPVATPTVALQSTNVFGSSAFSLDASKLPATLPANGSGTFTITFAPGQTDQATANLVVGPNTYGIVGTGIVVTDIDALQISYADDTGVRTNPQAATPISFGQVIPGDSGATLHFTISNPQTSFNAVTLTTLGLTGSAYSLSVAPALPVTIQPNSSITFSITFNATSSGTFTGTLAIGTRIFNLTGLSVVSPVPTLSLQVSQSPLTSAQQVNLTVQASAPSKVDAIGQLAMTFTPSVNGVTDDPSIVFLATGGRDLQVTLASGSQTATYNSQSAIGFQTGTTAGTIMFTLTFPNTPPVTQSYSITPATIHISNATALRQDPNLVIAIDGFDNTYTAGQLAFTFYDLNGNKINSTPMSVDATSNFHQYFYTSNPAGGSFAMQASFPVTGDVTKIGSVSVVLTNSAGQSNTKLTFQ